MAIIQMIIVILVLSTCASFLIYILDNPDEFE